MRGIGVGHAIGHIEGVAYQEGILGRLHPDLDVYKRQGLATGVKS